MGPRRVPAGTEKKKKGKKSFGLTPGTLLVVGEKVPGGPPGGAMGRGCK